MNEQTRLRTSLITDVVLIFAWAVLTCVNASKDKPDRPFWVVICLVMLGICVAMLIRHLHHWHYLNRQIEGLAWNLQKNILELADWYAKRTDLTMPGISKVQAGLQSTLSDTRASEHDGLLDPDGLFLAIRYMDAMDVLSGEHHAENLKQYIEELANHPGQQQELETVYRNKQQQDSL